MAAVVIAGWALMLWRKQQHRHAVLVLTLSALTIRLFAATLDPFLNYWDEVYHAAVAKNMVHHPFTPMLYTESAMPITTTDWTRMHIWLHKPPFFLWQMAASVCLFGNEPWAVRIPSALWTAALVPVTYRIAQLLTADRLGAFIAAALTTFCCAIQELTSGALGTDHNDAIFISVVACSYWTLLEWTQRSTWRWALTTGLFTGCAVLTKWYVGAFVLLPWGLIILHRRLAQPALSQFVAGCTLASVLVCAWIANMTLRFPQESAYQWWFKAQHFTVAMDSHEGPWYFHFNAISTLLWPLAWWSLLPALIWLIWSAHHIEQRIFLLATLVPVHLFFGLAATKMLGYTLVLLPLYLTATGHALSSLTKLIKPIPIQRWITALAVVALALALLDIEYSEEHHTVYAAPTGNQVHRRQQLAVPEAEALLLLHLHGPEKDVLFGLPKGYDVQFMFRYGYQCMAIIPTTQEVQQLTRKGYEVVVLQDGRSLDLFPPGVRVITDDMVLFPRIARL